MRRREFLVSGAATGLVLTFRIPFGRAAEDAPRFAPNAFLRIGSDDTITVLIHKSEMGQGVMTSIPQMLAEELGADWSKIKVENGLPVPAYVMKGDFGQQFTGGSTSTRKSWTVLLEAGAAARQMLIAAAAPLLGVAPDACRTERGMVIAEGKDPIPFGKVAAAAAKLSVPHHVSLKDPARYQMIGKDLPRLDIPAKVNGSAIFAIDVTRPGMLVTSVLRCPHFGGTVAKYDAAKTLAVPGVKQVVPVFGARPIGGPIGLAVVAEGFWPALKGRRALNVTWDMGPNAAVTSESVSQGMEAALVGSGGRHITSRGSKSALEKSAKKLEAVYELPYLAHAPMEPLTAVAEVREGSCEIWAGTQSQTLCIKAAKKLTGLPKEAIKVHTTLLGGGFGRRGFTDFVQDAVEVSKKVGKPIKVIFSREDEIQHGFYRPANRHHIAGGVAADGTLSAWSHKLATPSIILANHFVPAFVGLLMNDPTSVDGAAELPYSIPNFHVRWVKTVSPAPIGFWRSVGNSVNGFVTESFVDELAAAAGADPLAFRLKHLGASPRHKAVLELAAEKADWGKPLPAGHHRGVALCQSFGSIVAEVAEVSVSPDDGTPTVHKVTVAVDCGKVVNPAIIKAQMMSGVVFGLTAALHGAITLDKGAVQQHSFNDYPLLRMRETPLVDAHVLVTDNAPGGIGEVGVPPAAPALTNAIFAATGVRIRKLPVDPALLTKATAAQ